MTPALAAFAALVLLHVGTQSMLLKASVGNRWTIGPRDTPAAPSPAAARAERALRNFTETAPAFLALVLAAHIGGRDNALIAGGTLAYLAGRTAYLPAYVLAVPYARTVAWLAATTGLAAMLAGVIAA